VNVQLKCFNQNKKIIENFLYSRGIGVVETGSSFTFVEKGCESINNTSIVLSFEFENLFILEHFIDSLSTLHATNQNFKINSDVVLGCREESFELIKTEEVFYFKTENDFTFCQTVHESLKVKLKLYEVEKNFKDKGFIRINKSTVVNILKINEIVPWFGGRILLRFDSLQDKLEVSRNYTKDFKSFLRM
jgi:DNA-binding LytR/AlgR family response regulator